MSLFAGAAQVDISPRKPLFLVGYPHVPRTSEGVHDPLYAAALCLRNGAESLILVAVDILFISHRSAELCRAAIAAATGIPPGHVLISATHTHSGPVTATALVWRDDPLVPPPDPEYMDQFHAGIVAAATQAWQQAVPARLAVTSARADGVGGNRLALDGLADPEVGLLQVVAADSGRPLAVTLVYSMHPTVLHQDSRLVSSDFPAFARRHLQEGNPGLVVLYHTGPAGNQSPRYHVSGQTFAEAERLGRRLGVAVSGALAALRDSDYTDRPRLAAAQARLDLPGRDGVALAEAQARLEAARRHYDDLKRAGAPHGPVRTAECVVFGAEELVTIAAAQASGELDAWRRHQLPAEVQVLRIGESFWVGLRGEVFVEYGLDIKRQAPPRTFVISLANGELQGYIVTEAADAAGGYEAACSLFPPAAGRLMTDQAIALIRQLAHP